MSRYIDAEWLEENAKEYSLGYYDADEWAIPLSVLDSAPSIDICVCKECKHWYGESEMYEDREYKKCWQLQGQYMNSDFWCKYGERQTERSSE